MHRIWKRWIRQRALLVMSLVASLFPILTVGASETMFFEEARTEVMDYFEEQLGNESLGQTALPLAALALVSGRDDLVRRFIECDPVGTYELWTIWEYIRSHANKRDIEVLLELCAQRFPDEDWSQGACLTLGEIGRLDYAFVLADAIECMSDRKRTLTDVARLRLVFYRDVAGARRAYMNRDGTTTESDFSVFCKREARYFDHDRLDEARQAIGLPMSHCWKILVSEREFLAFLMEHHELAIQRNQTNHAGQEIDDDDEGHVKRIIGTSFLRAIRAANTGAFEQVRQQGREIDEMFERRQLPESIRDARWLRGGRAFLAMLGRDREFLQCVLESEVCEDSLLKNQTEALLIASIEVGLLDEVIRYLNANTRDAPFLLDYTEDIGVTWLREAGTFERFREQLGNLRDARIRMQILAFVLLSGEHHVVGSEFK